MGILLPGDTTRDTSFCDAIANIYNEMVLKFFINTIVEPHVKRLTAEASHCPFLMLNVKQESCEYQFLGLTRPETESESIQ